VISSATTLVGVIGDPVAHSLSPRMQNAAFAAAGLDWAYVPLRVAPDRLAEALRGLPGLSFAGANVTIPHKEGVAALVDETTDVARAAGSVNTIVVRRDGTLLGDSTDGGAVTGGLEAAAGAGALAGRVLVLGAGGSARAVISALTAAGADVGVWSRRPEAAQTLATALGVAAHDRLPSPLPPVIVNCTPLGGAKALTESPVAADSLSDVHAVCDLAYRPDAAPTVLCGDAAARGIAVVDGLEVLVRQGARSFAIWTGVEPDLTVMRAALRS
jgi:shikimate dehydrogenase